MSGATGADAGAALLHALKDKPKEERMEIARQLLKSMESELTEVMANALAPDASGSERKNMQDVVLGALLQDGRNTIFDANEAAHREAEIKTTVSETEADKSTVIAALKVAMQQENRGVSDAQASVETSSKPSDQVADAAKTSENDNSSEIASILHALKNQTENADSKMGASADGSVRALTVEELNAADALQKATMISAAGAWQGQSVFPPASRTSLSDAIPDAQSRKGTSVPSGAVLTERDVIEIFLQRPKRAVDQNGLNTFTADSAAKPTLLAEQYNVASKTIRDIWNRNTWLRLTRPFWNAEELAAAGEKPADAEGLIPAQTRKRGRPCGTKDAVPRTRSCRKRVPGEDGEEEEVKPKKKGGKKRPTLVESGNFQAFVSALVSLGEREQQASAAASAEGVEPAAQRAQTEAADVMVKMEAQPPSSSSSSHLGQASGGAGHAAAQQQQQQQQQHQQQQQALMQQAQLQQHLASNNMCQSLFGGVPVQLMAPYGGAAFGQQVGLPFISVPIIPPELWAAYGVGNSFGAAGAGDLGGLDMRNPAVAAAVAAAMQQQQQQQHQQNVIHMPTAVHPAQSDGS